VLNQRLELSACKPVNEANASLGKPSKVGADMAEVSAIIAG
jgi:hypothetical protein